MSTSENTITKKEFRKDINGLRAIAVLCVLLFHICSFNSLNSNNFYLSIAGGYVGVDIFFVISGFLMTSIIVKGLSNKNFSILHFWKRRAKRICPALLVAIILFYIVGYFFLVNIAEFYEFNKEASAALGFVSNFRFSKDEGYFAIDSMSKILLHTWSLSVEWQFYIIYPIIVLILNKLFGLKVIKFAIVTIFFISLAQAFIFNGEKYYYMLNTRAWELLAGAIVYLFPIYKIKKLSLKYKWSLEGLGIFLILSIFFKEDNNIWSATTVLPSILGTMLIMTVDCERSILSNSLFQYLGKISYSLYIYHWLVLSIFARINLVSNFYLLATTILILSMISYHFIECSRNYGWKFLIIYLSMIGLTVYTVDKHGFLGRYNLEVTFGGQGAPDFELGYNNEKKEADYALLGDSHALHFWNFFKEHKLKLAIFASSGTYCYDAKHCRFSPIDYKKNIVKRYGSLENFSKKRQEFLESLKPGTKIIVSQRWSSHFEQDALNWIVNKDKTIKDEYLEQGIGALIAKNPNLHFYVLGTLFGSKAIYQAYDCINIKTYNNYLPEIIKNSLKCPEPKFSHEQKIKNINTYLKTYFSKFSNVTFIDPNTALCNENFCNLKTNEGKQIFWDDNHLSKDGAELIGKYIIKII